MYTTQQLLSRSDAFDLTAPEKAVSSRSLWVDLVWRLDTDDTGYSPRGITLTWWPGAHAGETPPASALTMIDFCKRLLWLLLADPALPFVNKPTSATNFCSACISLIRFALVEGLESFDEVTPKVVERYCTWIAKDLEAKHPDQVDDERWLAERVRSRLYVLQAGWAARRRLSDSGTLIPTTDPFEGRSVSEVAGCVADAVDRAVPPIPTEPFLAIVNTAANIILHHADDVLAAQDEWFRITGGFGSLEDRKRATDAIGRLKFTTVGKTSLRWPAGLRDAAFPWHDQSPSARLAKLIQTVRDAGEIVLLATTGVRIGELIAIPGGWTQTSDLPDCLERERDQTGLLDVYLVRSKLFKGQAAPVEERWVVGSGPVGIDSVPIAVVAIRLLDRLMSPLRALSSDTEAQKALSVQLTSAGMPKSSSAIRRSVLTTTTDRLRLFCRDWVDFSAIPDFSADLAGTDLRQIRDSRGSTLKARQFRKNFAQYVISVDSGLLAALQSQYKHMKAATTQNSYIGNDPRRIGGIDSERRRSSSNSIKAMLGLGDNGWGRLRELIIDHEQRFHIAGKSERFASLTAEEADELGIALIPGDLGDCGIAFAPHLSRCNQIAGTASSLNTTPNVKFRCPLTCAGCALFAADSTHRPYWRRRLALNQKLWDLARERGLENDYQVAHDRIRQSKAVLKSLGEDSDA